MKVLIVDMTHGGIKIALEFLKNDKNKVYAYDIYKTLKKQDKKLLQDKGLVFVNEVISDKDTLVISPVHCIVNQENQISHHKAVGLLLKDRIKCPIIEVTGVKGKTSVVHMLKEILKEFNPLILTSLGIEVIENGQNYVLDENISITPANIIKAWELAQNYQIGIYILESSLGGTGLADVGVLTNLAENYPISQGTKTASQAKTQIFKSKLVACDYTAFKSYYSDFSDKTITFGLENSDKVKVSPLNINLGLNETHFKVKVNNLKTINGNLITTKFNVSTFAPAKHHLNNVLSAICASLILEVPIEIIKKGLNNYKGIKGRTSIIIKDGATIIEEINPGINVKAVEKSFDIINNYEDCAVIFGGKYGVTCEEIDEDKAAKFLSNTKNEVKLILTDELGKNIMTKISRKVDYKINIEDALNFAIELGYKNILLIYRSNYADINKR
ncbi:MAG: coenzyme F430 synthase [Methanomicrobiales archaeon]